MVFLKRSEMASLADDRERLAEQAETAGDRLAKKCAAELRDHADQLRRGINPYEPDTEIWQPGPDGGTR